MTFALRVFVTLLEACVSSSQGNKTSLILDVRFASSFRKKFFKPKAYMTGISVRDTNRPSANL